MFCYPLFFFSKWFVVLVLIEASFIVATMCSPLHVLIDVKPMKALTLDGFL